MDEMIVLEMMSCNVHSFPLLRYLLSSRIFFVYLSIVVILYQFLRLLEAIGRRIAGIGSEEVSEY